MVKPRLLILSDLFGGTTDWLKCYTDLLKPKFEIQYYDVLELAEIDSDNLTENEIHNQFLIGGIDKAVEYLLKLETKEVAVLGFSIGGTIAWKASIKGLNVTHLFAVSSTRLRYEVKAPNGNIKLYFGKKDPNKPNSKWFMDFNLENEILVNQDHQLYFIEDNIFLICDDILKI
jgi:dienelactone hydrolase